MPSEAGLLTEVIELREKATDRYCPSAEMRCLSGAPGSTTYRDRELRSFFCRLVGWADEVTALVDDMMHTLRSAVARRTPIVLRGESDLIPVAHALHRRLFDSDRPFVVCDPRRCEGDGSVRTPPNRRTGMLALETRAGSGVGVAVSVTTIPAAAYLGVAVGLGEVAHAPGALAVLGVNVLMLVIASSCTLLLQRFVAARQLARRQQRTA